MRTLQTPGSRNLYAVGFDHFGGRNIYVQTMPPVMIAPTAHQLSPASIADRTDSDRPPVGTPLYRPGG